MDHVAITLFLKHVDNGAKLTLYLPCVYNRTTQELEHRHPGPQANAEHRDFACRTGIDSLVQIEAAIAKGANIQVVYADLKLDPKGWDARNAKVAACVKKTDRLLAFSWHKDVVPKPNSGTRRTWDMCCGSKKHVFFI